jgi:hypothetical protein
VQTLALQTHTQPGITQPLTIAPMKPSSNFPPGATLKKKFEKRKQGDRKKMKIGEERGIKSKKKNQKSKIKNPADKAMARVTCATS